MLYLGVGRETITPEIGVYLGGYPFPDRYATSVNDDLTVTAFSFSCNGQRSMLVSATVVVLDNNLSLKIRRNIEAETGIPAESIIVHTTHTHSAPVTFTSDGWGTPNMDYVDRILIPKTVEAAKFAANNEVHVTFGFAQGKSLVGVNRREPSLIQNSIKLGVWEYGCFDPKMSVLSFKNDSGECVANIIHYGCHATGCGPSLEITRDWPGIMTDRVEKISGGITAFINGPQGDVGPRLSNHRTTGEGDIGYMKEQGALAAHDAAEIFADINVYREVDMKCTARLVKLPIEPLMPYEDAKRKYDDIKATDGITRRESNYYRQIMAAYEQGEEKTEYREHQQTAIRIGDVAFVGHPFETFSEIGLRINVMSKIPHVLSIAMANGNECYLPTVGEIPRGGYEVRMFKSHALQPYTNDVDYSLITESVKTLEELI